MTSSRPISNARTIWLIARLAMRRQINTWQGARFGRKKNDSLVPGETRRSATPSKSHGRSLFSSFILLVMAFNGFSIGARGLLRLSSASRDITNISDKIPVTNETEVRIVETESALFRAREISDPDQREKYRGLWNRYLDDLFIAEVRRDGLSEEDENTRLQQMHDVFQQKGAAGFYRRPALAFWVSRETWPRDAQSSSVFFRSLSLIMLLWIPFLVFAPLGMNNKNLGEVEWNFEWLFTFPASARALFTSKIFVYSFLNPIAWVFFYPFLILVYVAAGYGFLAIFLGLAALLYVMLLTGSVCTFLEMALRKFLSLSQLKNFQALFTVLGTVSLLLVYGASLSKVLEDFMVAHATAMPEFFAWNPFSLPLVLGLRSTAGWQTVFAVVLMISLGSGFCFVALLGSEWLTRDGLVRAGGPYQGTRNTSPGRPGNTWLRGVAAYEMLLLGRDRNLLVQVLVLPLFLPTFYLLINEKMISAVSGNFRNGAMLAFGVGAYSFLSSAIPILNREDKTLWQLLTFPQSLTTILAKKAMVWTAIGLLYGGATLLLIARFSRHLHASSLGDVFLVLYGIALYGFIASGIGILATNVLESEPRARFRTDMVYLYMILAAMYGNTIYSPSLWAKFAQITLSTLLAFALWQKVKDNVPYLLDPVALPTRSLSLADGMIAALAFFVIQSLIFLAIRALSDASLAAQITIAYIFAGMIVAGGALFIFWRQHVPDLWREIGIARTRNTAEPQKLKTGLIRAVILGGLAGVGAILYLRALNFFPQGQIWKQDAQLSSFLTRADRPIWICILAIIAAPIFEEFLFRGLIFQGLRRTAGPALAILGSAAIFALVHPPISAVPVFGLGIAAAISFQRSGFLLAPVLTHAVYNTIVIFLNKS
jgi:hypothetical protein